MGKVRTELTPEQIRLRKKMRERQAQRLAEQKQQENDSASAGEVSTEDVSKRLEELEELMAEEAKTEEEKNKRRFQVVVKGKKEDADTPKDDGKWNGQGAKTFLPSGAQVSTEEVATPTGKEAQKLQALIGNAKAETTVAIGDKEGVDEV
ncbi:MAG: hypothetical protein MHM6MM_007482, partial [Cercozoa sp. M6MM]